MEQIGNGIWKLVLGEPETLTPSAFRVLPIKQKELNELPLADLLPEPVRQITWKVTNRGVTVELPMKTTEDIYGFGLQLKSMNQAGRKRRIRVNSDPPADTGESHAPVPFYVSTAGYGLFADTFRYADFYMGTNARKGTSASQKSVNEVHEEFSESALYSLKKAQEERRIIINIPHVKGITLYVFSGTLMEAVKRYNLFSGGGCTVPMWGLGNWYRVYGGSDQTAVEALADELRKEQIPVDVLGIEPGWHSHSYSCTFEWSYLFPNPDAMNERLNSLGYRVNLWEHAFVYPAAEIYEELAPYSGDYEVWSGLVPDFAHEKAREIFGEFHGKRLIDKGISGFKLDECDNSDYNPSNWSFPDTTEFPSGMDGEQMHNGIGTLYQNVLYQQYAMRSQRTYSEVRSSGSMAAPLPFVLYSDLYNHRDFIRGIVTSGFSGLLWSPEVRNCENPNDLLRRLETVIFSAQSLLNCWRIPMPPWKQVDVEKNLSGEVMEDSHYYMEVCGRFLKLRMSLLPYLYSAFAEYRKTGKPPLRALVMDYQDDESLRRVDDQYLFGDAMMVCPLTLEDGTCRTVRMPEGIWHGFFTGEVYEGGKDYLVEAHYDQIPVFVKDGTLLPLADPVDHITSDTVFHVHVRSFGGGETSFILYEDDFETLVLNKERDTIKENQVYLCRDKDGIIRYERVGDGPVRYDIYLD